MNSELKKKNIERARNVLIAAGIAFEEKNDSRHFIIKNPVRIDYWPSTCKIMPIGTRSYKASPEHVVDLIKKLSQNQKSNFDISEVMQKNLEGLEKEELISIIETLCKHLNDMTLKERTERSNKQREQRKSPEEKEFPSFTKPGLRIEKSPD